MDDEDFFFRIKGLLRFRDMLNDMEYTQLGELYYTCEEIMNIIEAIFEEKKNG